MGEKTVLVAIDLADLDDAPKILQKAWQLATLSDARLAVVTVLPDFGMSIVGSFFKEGAAELAMKDAATSLHSLITSTLGALPDSKIAHIVRQGSTYREILKAAKTFEAGLIVMGAQRSDNHDGGIGPNAARVMRQAKCSVMVLRD